MAGPFFATLLVVFTAGNRLHGRRLWLAAALGAVITAVSISVDPYATPRSRTSSPC